MLVTWDNDNASALWDAVQHGRIKGWFVDLRGGNTAGMPNDKLRHAAPDARNATDGQCGVA
jgi:hypothetical protein